MSIYSDITEATRQYLAAAAAWQAASKRYDELNKNEPQAPAIIEDEATCEQAATEYQAWTEARSAALDTLNNTYVAQEKAHKQISYKVSPGISGSAIIVTIDGRRYRLTGHYDQDGPAVTVITEEPA